MKEKFADLLEKMACWKVVYNDVEYKPEDIARIVFANIKTWKLQGVELTNGEYILGVGDKSFHHLICVFLASVLNLKLILIGHKQLAYFETPNCLISIKYIVSSRKICSVNKQILLLHFEIPKDFDHFPYAFLDLNKLGQTEIAFCTSGTTSDFKIARYYEYKLYKNAEIVGSYMGLSKHDKCLCMFPLCYMYGFSVTISTLIKGGTVILENSTLPPAAVVEYLINNSITLLPVLGSIIDDLTPYIYDNLFFPNLKIINASDKIYVSHVKKIFKLAPVFWNNMGQTESGPRLFSLKITKQEEGLLSRYSYNNVIALGRPVDPGIKVLVRKENGLICEHGEIGELFYNTKFGMEGYLNVDSNPEDMWHSSGDLVYCGKNEIIYWVGRKSQLIKINGVFINTNLLHVFSDKLPFIRSSFYISDEESNEIYGFFSIDSSVVKSEEKAVQLIAEHYALAFPLYPRIAKYIFVQELPRTENGKINLKELKLLAKNF